MDRSVIGHPHAGRTCDGNAVIAVRQRLGLT